MVFISVSRELCEVSVHSRGDMIKFFSQQKGEGTVPATMFSQMLHAVFADLSFLSQLTHFDSSVSVILITSK